MTITLRSENVFDKILKMFGKKRAFYVPRQNGRYLYQQAIPESFLRAFLRPAHRYPPTGWFYLSELLDATKAEKNTVKNEKSP